MLLLLPGRDVDAPHFAMRERLVAESGDAVVHTAFVEQRRGPVVGSAGGAIVASLELPERVTCLGVEGIQLVVAATDIQGVGRDCRGGRFAALIGGRA